MSIVPRFSVIFLSYNQVDYVVEAIQSVLAGGFRDFEIVCVDDGSTDGSAEALERLAHGDPRLRLYRQAHSGRPAVGRNNAIRHARGEYLCFLDGDDLYDSRKLTALNDALVSHGDAADVVFHDYVDFPDGGRPENGVRKIHSAPIEMRLLALARVNSAATTDAAVRELDSNSLACLLVSDSFVVYTGSICIRRQHLTGRSAFFPEDRITGEDNVVWLRCIVGARVFFLNEALVFWRKTVSSLTAVRNPEAQRELIRSLREQREIVNDLLTPEQREATRSRILWEILTLGDLLESRGAIGAAMNLRLRACIEFPGLTTLLRLVKTPLRAVKRPRGS